MSMAGVGPGPGSGSGSSSTSGVSQADIMEEGFSGELSSDQPTTESWVGDTDPKQAGDRDAGTTMTPSHGPEASRPGVGPGPS